MMVSYLKNKYGEIITFIEWWEVDKNGIMEEQGEYLYINNYYCCNKYRNRNRKLFNKLKKMIISKVSDKCNYAYWIRLKNDKKIKRIYNINKFKR